MDVETLLARQPTEGRALYVDMNSFFASVEQQLKPHLRGRPVGVCPFINDNTCVIAASVEAKRAGISTGTPVRQARILCPDITLISDDPSQYRHYHRRIMESLRQTRCQVTVKSIDEAFLQLPSDLTTEAVGMAKNIKRYIHQIGDQLGSSIGIASNMFLAKMGTKLQKPYGLVEIKLQDLEALYSVWDLTDLYGISWRMQRRLNAIGIYTPPDFYNASHGLLKRAFGINGERWYLRLRGYEVDERQTTRRMIGHQTTIVPDPARTKTEVLSVASQLCYKAAARLRAADLAAKSIYVGVRYTDRTYWGRILRTYSPFSDSQTFFQHVEQALGAWHPSKPVRLVYVSSFDLMPTNAITASLFDPPYRSERLCQALDEIEQRWGRHTIAPASQMLSTRIVDRVGFGNAHQAAAVFT